MWQKEIRGEICINIQGKIMQVGLSGSIVIPSVAVPSSNNARCNVPNVACHCYGMSTRQPYSHGVAAGAFAAAIAKYLDTDAIHSCIERCIGAVIICRDSCFPVVLFVMSRSGCCCHHQLACSPPVSGPRKQPDMQTNKDETTQIISHGKTAGTAQTFTYLFSLYRRWTLTHSVRSRASRF